MDLTPQTASKFYTQIEADPAYQAAKRDLRVQADLRKLVLDPLDYTASLPLGLSVLLGLDVDGMRVISAQNEVPGLLGSGHNLVLGGDDGQAIAYLRPTGKLIAGVSNRRSALIEVDDDGLRLDNGVIVPGSVINISVD